MKAAFWWNGLEVKVEGGGGQVVLSLRRPPIMSGSWIDGVLKETVEVPEENFTVGLDKSATRSLASAMMGAAAEI